MNTGEPKGNQIEKMMKNALETGMYKDIKGLWTQP